MYMYVLGGMCKPIGQRVGVGRFCCPPPPPPPPGLSKLVLYSACHENNLHLFLMNCVKMETYTGVCIYMCNYSKREITLLTLPTGHPI